MALYKNEKINPVAGCLPLLLQIPVFYALYKVLTVTIEMRHQPFLDRLLLLLLRIVFEALLDLLHLGLEVPHLGHAGVGVVGQREHDQLDDDGPAAPAG